VVAGFELAARSSAMPAYRPKARPSPSPFLSAAGSCRTVAEAAVSHSRNPWTFFRSRDALLIDRVLPLAGKFGRAGAPSIGI
jgi:hypothetical protein